MPAAIVYRILGNDAWPHHGLGQTEQNLRWLLANEPELPGAEKRWILNRILSPRAEARLVKLLERQDHKWLRLPFDSAKYRTAVASGPARDFGPCNSDLVTERQRRYHAAVLYAANINGARNAAICDAEATADWVLPLDGATAFDAAGWAALRRAMQGATTSFLPIPIYRLRSKCEFFDFATERFVDREDEPQLALRAGSANRFDERLRWGRLDKVELLNRLDSLQPGSLLAKPELRAGWCLRLPAARRGAVRGSDMMARVAKRTQAARWLLWRADVRANGLLAACADRIRGKWRQSDR